MPVCEEAVTEQSHRRRRSKVDDYDSSADVPDAAPRPVPRSPSTASSRWGWLNFRRWGIRSKLIVVLLIPTTAAVVLGGLRIQSSLDTINSYSQHQELAGAVKQSAATVAALENERDLTAGYMASNPRPSTGSGVIPADVDREVSALRTSFASVDFSVDETLRTKVEAALNGFSRLPAVRASALSLSTPPHTVFAAYTAMIDRLLAVNYELGEGLPAEDVSEQTAALVSLGGAEEAASTQRATIYSALSADAFTRSAFANLATAHAQWSADVKQFKSQASPAQLIRFQSVVQGADVDQVDQVVRTALASDSPDVLGTLGVTADQWFDIASGQINLVHQVEVAQLDDITREITDLRSSARTGALVSAGIILAILIFALLATLIVARSLLKPLQRLRSAALNVAHTRLPETVRRLQSSRGDDTDIAVAPIHIDSNDEIGQVARAFDDVHSQAVHLAGEQALIRGSLSSLFLNLSRRSQALVERQLGLIDELESSEKDPDRLASLFKLDHLATRMRRNDENLLVLAGASEGGRRHMQSVSLVDVVRAASAEVEQYARVQIELPPSCDLTGPAAKDIVHLIAELLENATTYSSPTTRVVARGRRLGSDGEFLIEVEDQGIGMTSQEFDSANQKLAAPAVIDVAMSQMMGLFVVARLAGRQGIQVRLRPSPSGGVTALVRLPAGVVHYASPDSEEQEPVASASSPSTESDAPFTPVSETDSAAGEPPVEAEPEPIPVGAQQSPRVPRPRPTRTATSPDRPPIFQELQSEWFKRPASIDQLARSAAPGVEAEPAAETREPAEPAETQPAPAPSSWQSPGDEGWRAAAALSEQSDEDLTVAGLPKRVPGRNLVPGSARGGNGRAPSQRSPEAARSLSDYQRGVGRARQAGAVAQEEPDQPENTSPEETR
jgi:HAMP domain-containing protein/anti-sigma regulatory factor (Ser/Thr protein kinase)